MSDFEEIIRLSRVKIEYEEDYIEEETEENE